MLNLIILNIGLLRAFVAIILIHQFNSLIESHCIQEGIEAQRNYVTSYNSES